ncbi:MAG: aromatic ring-opening dioxygenase LigA [Dermatophilaceae bacterium]
MANTAHAGRVRGIGLITMIVGVIFVVAGVLVYADVSKTLGEQQITVSSDAAAFAGQHVTQPWQAYSEAMTISEHASKIADGKAYAQLPQNDPDRQQLMTASFLQASLFTSVVAFGVAFMAAVIGAVFILVGVALRSVTSVAWSSGAGAPAAAIAS